MDSPDSYRGKFPTTSFLQLLIVHYVYVIKSSKDDSFYIGRTSTLEERLKYHNSTHKNIGVTRRNIPWNYHYTLEVESSIIASKIEKHIKRMKSRRYLKNLAKYPEIGEKLVKKYS